MKTEKNQKTKGTLFYQFLKLVEVKKIYFCDFCPFSWFFWGGQYVRIFFKKSFLKTGQKNHEIGQKSQK